MIKLRHRAESERTAGGPGGAKNDIVGCVDGDMNEQVRPRAHRHGSNKQWAALLCLFVASVPVVSLYIGFSLGNALGPPRRKFADRGTVVDIGRLNYTWYNTHNVTVQFAGGLGNQMFQYAALYGVAKANGLKPIINMENRLVDIFPAVHQASRVIPEQGMGADYGRFVEMKSNSFDSRTFSLNFMKNIILEGFFQSWRYFDHVRADVRKLFAFRPEVQTRAEKIVREAHDGYVRTVGVKRDERHDIQYVGVHIRRSDMLEDVNVKKGYTVADAAFIRKAMRYYEETYKNVIFVVCTDDPEWARNNTKTESPSSHVVFSPYADLHPALDLCVLSQLNHTIITVGTYGWWGAWLAGGDVVYFKDFPKPFTELASQFKHPDYYVMQWIPI